MRNFAFLMRHLSFCGLLVMVSACSANTPSAATESEAPATTLAEQLQAIKALASDKACEQASDCQAIEIGHMPCGGPEEFLIISSKSTDKKKLDPMVERYNAERTEAVKKSGLMGICVRKMPPALLCENGQCKAQNTKIVY